MKVLVVSPYYDSHGGGVEKVAAKLASEVSRIGPSVTWCALDVGEGLPEKEVVNIAALSGNNYFENILGFPYPLMNFTSLVRLQKEIKSADVVHIHDYIYFSSICAFSISKMAGKRVVITQHIGMINYRSRVLRFILSSINKTLGALMLSKASSVVFISDHVKEYFEKLVSGTNNNWHYIPNGVDMEVFNLGSKIVESSKGRKKILFVGRFVEKKGLLFLKEVVRRLDMFDWVFVGRGPLNPLHWEFAHVQVIGQVDSKEYLADIYRKASLLVLPSHGEGFPLVVQEAVASGVPVLTSLDVATGNMAAQEYLFVEDIWSEDAESKWASRIEDILCKPVDQDRLISAIDFARGNWSWPQIAEKYLRLYAY